jgi:hypothetical protein
MKSALKLPIPELEKLYYIEVKCSPPIHVGDTGKGVLNIIPINGGRFEGPKMSGEVLNIGADWNTIQSDLIGKVNTRYVLKTDDGAIISLATDVLHKYPRNFTLKLSPENL